MDWTKLTAESAAATIETTNTIALQAADRFLVELGASDEQRERIMARIRERATVERDAILLRLAGGPAH
ncbi:MAG TPA: hypothetical protein VGD94_23550 [Vicinamibacterales bacterium]